LKFCSRCGANVSLEIPPGDDRERAVCRDCGEIHYQNPRVIVGCLPVHENRILLCRRAIEPRYGFWTLPAGFMENGESTAEGAARETWEEAAAQAEDLTLYRLFDIPQINQIYVFYRCGIADGVFGVGSESLESQLFSEADIPWSELAFPVVKVLLEEYFEDRKTATFPIRQSVIRHPRR
jgi:ADP-ribose pyrophosphatase YjhB (NUDIX family)